MRTLLDTSGMLAPGTVLDDASLLEAYAAPARRWHRANFVATLDGAATGDDNRSGSINTISDHIVFDLLRRLADVVVVGAGTVRAEGYPSLRAEDPSAPPLVVVSNSGQLPLSVSDGPFGSVFLVTREKADARAIDASRELIGEDFVLLCGRESVDLAKMRDTLEDKGFRQILTEGGPQLLASMLAARVLDELDLTWSPKLVAGDHKRIVDGTDLDVALSPMLLLEEDGSIIGRWRVGRHGSAA